MVILADGDRKNKTLTKQHGSHRSVITGSVDSLRHDRNKLLDKNALTNSFLDKKIVRKRVLPRTVKSYLSSLKHQCDFGMLHKPQEIPPAEKQKILTV
jgi:hypothetical protein